MCFFFIGFNSVHGVFMSWVPEKYYWLPCAVYFISTYWHCVRKNGTNLINFPWYILYALVSPIFPPLAGKWHYARKYGANLNPLPHVVSTSIETHKSFPSRWDTMTLWWLKCAVVGFSLLHNLSIFLTLLLIYDSTVCYCSFRKTILLNEARLFF